MTVKYKNNESLWMIPWGGVQPLIDGQYAIKYNALLQMADTAEKAKEIASSVINQLPEFEGYKIDIGDPILIGIDIINKVVESECDDFDEETTRE
jgi:hypothetical protein